MHTSKTISHTTLTLVAALSLALGLTVALKWTVKAQEPPAIVSAEALAAAAPSEVLSPVMGTGDGLSGSYFGNSHLFGTPLMNRVDAEVNSDFNAALESDGPVKNAADFAKRSSALLGKSNPRQFSVSWSGEIQAQFTEPYTFHLDSDDGVRVWLNEQLIIDDWKDGDRVRESAPVNLAAGQKYSIRIQYYQNQYAAHVKFKWSSPSTPNCLVPQSQLYSQELDADKNGLADSWEMAHFGHLGVDPNADPDGDGLSNMQEYLRYSDPNNPQTCGVPDAWRSETIGINSVGDANYSDGVFTVTSSGWYIWGNSDSFQYLYQPMGTNGQIVARLMGLSGTTNVFAKGGLMIRETLDHDSRNVLLSINVTNSLSFQWRDWAGGGTYVSVGSTNQATPCWLKVVRRDNWLGGYRSPDGTNWTLCGWEVLNGLAPQVLVGLAVASRQPDVPCTASYDQVSVGVADPKGVLNPVMGSGDGLLGNYYKTQSLYGPSVTNKVDTMIDFNWVHWQPMGLPIAAPFGVCWTGEIQAQFSEPYTFYLASKNQNWVRLWVNNELVINGWKSGHPEGDLSGTINLKAGQRYLVRVEFYADHALAVVKMYWSSPSTPRRLVPTSQMYSQPTDTDGNGLPDIWEDLYFGHLGVDPNADPDGDGLSNLQEYLRHSDPIKSDTDGDGIPDGWEIAHGLNPTFDDTAEDPDQDGLNNLQEYTAGTDPNNPYSHGDGVLDGVEVNYLGGKTVSATEVAAVNGAYGRAIMGRWETDGAGIYALDRRGEVEFKLTTTSADKLLLRLEGTQHRADSPHTVFSLLLSVDGESLGHRTLTAGYGTNGIVEYLTPFLPAGTHKVRVFWDGTTDVNSLHIKQVKLLSIAGADANHNSIKDWVERALKAESGRDTNAPLASYTSPACLEGRDPYLSMMSLRVGAGPANIIPVRHNAGLRWYANVPLYAKTDTDVRVSYQNGGKTEKCSLQWLPLNVLDANNLIIRTGDSLLLGANAGQQARVRISVALGTQILAVSTTTADQPLPYLFASNGTYTVTATVTPKSGSPQTGSSVVKVVGHSFPNNNPACWAERRRDWDVQSVTTNVVLEADSRLSAEQTATLPDNGARLSLLIDQSEPRYIVSRLGGGGPILDSTTANGFRLFATPDTYNQVVETYPDASRLVETMEVLSPMLPNLTVQIRVIAGGVTFDDGTTYKELSTTDFDALGQYKLRFLMPDKAVTANCHRITVMQGAAWIGDY
jgi:hypothetical protein